MKSPEELRLLKVNYGVPVITLYWENKKLKNLDYLSATCDTVLQLLYSITIGEYHHPMLESIVLIYMGQEEVACVTEASSLIKTFKEVVLPKVAEWKKKHDNR